MDFDANQFLTDVFETAVSMKGPPALTVGYAINHVLSEHMADLKRLVEANRSVLVEMTEERRRTGKIVRNRWKV